MILFYVVLPYIFLVNTSDNKNVWINNGFAKMIRNVASKGINGESIQQNDENMEKGIEYLEKTWKRRLANKKQTSNHLPTSAVESQIQVLAKVVVKRHMNKRFVQTPAKMFTQFQTMKRTFTLPMNISYI